MNGTALVLGTLLQGESRLADQLTHVARRHRAEHEVHHVASDLADWSREHVRRLAEAARARDLALTLVAPDAPEPAAQGSEPGLLLLRDLRDLHLSATENSLNWEMLTQVAQATGDEGLLAMVSECRPHTLRQLRWTNTMIKNLAPQILTSR
ncbi:hypothetical protein OHU34_39725 [Streptomyces sp. NBC_00080]|uniref:hypothetical protein n=1 Tax=Streptomyces sp. NBC_00080 TaxID=2975645 RepID=UPI003255C3AE